jgi:hypothetical protein
MDIGRVGIWRFLLDEHPTSRHTKEPPTRGGSFMCDVDSYASNCQLLASSKCLTWSRYSSKAALRRSAA